MSRIELNIVALGNFSNINSEISALRAKVESLNKTLSGVGLNSNQIASVKNMVAEFDRAVMSTGQFSSKTVQLQSETEKFGKALESGKLKLREYYNIISQGSKQAQSQLRALALEQTKLQNSLVISDPLKKGMATVYTPKVINEVTNATKIATNQQMLYNLALDRGSTSLINWGKNTQWAGRQLTVGLTVPLTIFGSAAAKVFQNMDAELIRMQKVYGTGLVQPTKEALASIRKDVGSLAKELANSWGVPITETAAMAADLAATGKTGLDLVNATREAIRLSKLGEVDRQQAMQATISLQNVYKLNTKQLSDAVNFLNAVENQTSTSLQDLVDAIPRVGPIVAQMGGSFKDTAAMMVAMKEAGVPAAQSANAIKAALASMINPTKAAREAFKAYGIDVAAIAGNNKGNAIGMLTDLQNKLKDLQPLAREQLVEKMFGKFQMSRITALLDNLNKVGSQSQTVFKLMEASSQQLSNMAQAELKVQTESTTGRYKRAIESLKADLVPIGEQFTKVITRLVQFGDTVVKFVDKLGPLKGVLGIILGFVAVAGPILMLAGVFGNLFGYIFKGIAIMRNLTHGVTGLKGVTGLLTAENIAAANASDLMGKKMLQEADSANILGNAITQINLKLADMQILMTNASMTSPLNAAGGSPYPKKSNTNDSGLQFVHGTPPVDLTEEQKSNLKNVASTDALKKSEIRHGYTNIGFMAPPSINEGTDSKRMTGIEAASYFEQNAQVATSQLLEAIISTVPAAANNPAVRADMQRLAINLAAELRAAGTAAVSDPVFYGAVERALTTTLTTATQETQTGIAAARQVVKVALYGDKGSRGTKGQRKALTPNEQLAIGNVGYSRTWDSSSPNSQITTVPNTTVPNTAVSDAALLDTALISNANNTAPAPTSQAGAAVSKSGILSKIKSPKIGGGMGGMGAMMLAQMFGDKLPSGIGSTISAAGTGAMIGSFIPGVGTLAGAAVGAAIGGISLLIQKEKEHAAVVKATFSASSTAVEMFGGTVNDVAISQHSFADLSGKSIQQLSQAQQYVTQIGKLNNTEPIKILADSLKGMDTGKSIIGNLKTFAAAQVAGGMDPSKVNEMVQAILTYAGKEQLITEAQKEIGNATKDTATATTTWLSKLSQASNGMDIYARSYDTLNTAQKATADGYLLVMNRILDVNAPLKTILANLQAISTAAGDAKEKYTSMILAATNANDNGLVSQLQTFQNMGFSPGAAGYLTKISQLAPEKMKGYEAGTTGLPATLKSSDVSAWITTARDPATWKEMAIAMNKSIDTQIGSQSQALTNEEQIKALEKKKKLVDEEITLQQKINDNLKKQQDYLVSQTDLQNQIKMARAGGDFLKVGLLQQQIAAKQQEYNAPQALSSLEKQSKLYADAIQKLQDAAAAAQQSVAQASIKALQDQKIKPGDLNSFAQGMIDSFNTALTSEGQITVTGNKVVVINDTPLTPEEIKTAAEKASKQVKERSKGQPAGYTDPSTRSMQLDPKDSSSRHNVRVFTVKGKEFATMDEKTYYEVISDVKGKVTVKTDKNGIPIPVKLQDGGHITGTGTGTSDSIPAYLSNGEYVVKASAVKQYGKGFFDSVNAQKFAGGGKVDNHATSMAEAYGYPKITNLSNQSQYEGKFSSLPLWKQIAFYAATGWNPVTSFALDKARANSGDNVSGLDYALDVIPFGKVLKGIKALKFLPRMIKHDLIPAVKSTSSATFKEGFISGKRSGYIQTHNYDERIIDWEDFFAPGFVYTPPSHTNLAKWTGSILGAKTKPSLEYGQRLLDSSSKSLLNLTKKSINLTKDASTSINNAIPSIPSLVETNLYKKIDLINTLNKARHASNEADLTKGLKHPTETDMAHGRYAGPGLYQATGNKGFEEALKNNYGKNLYKLGLTPSAWIKVLKSKGLINPNTFAKWKLENPEFQYSNIETATWDSPLIQKLISEGYIGFNYDGNYFTNWLVGAEKGFGLKPLSKSNGGYINNLPKFHSGGMVPGGYGKEMLAMLQGGEVVLPKEIGKRSSSYPSSSVMDSLSNNNVTNHFDVTINVPNTSANAQEIAQVVMRTIKTQQDKVYTTGRVI